MTEGRARRRGGRALVGRPPIPRPPGDGGGRADEAAADAKLVLTGGEADGAGGA
uniref:DUF834 domain-containing protein n=1 Tax=Setaria italica TaxID=4555 RepID=K4A4B4_SETIT